MPSVAMTVAQAKQIARRWVFMEAKNLSGFTGAYFAGSVNWMNDDAPLPVTSDVDIAIVVDADEVANHRQRKFRFEGTLLETTYHSIVEYQGPEEVVGNFFLAPQFRTKSVIADPTGKLE